MLSRTRYQVDTKYCQCWTTWCNLLITDYPRAGGEKVIRNPYNKNIPKRHRHTISSLTFYETKIILKNIVLSIFYLTTECCTTLGSRAEYKAFTALLHYQSTALNTDITGPPANTPATNTANTAASFMRKNSSPSSNSNSVVMSEEITDSAVGKTLEDKILKLKELIEDCSNSSKQNKSDNQYDKCEKLQHKLRYLEYYQSYDLGDCPE